MFEKEAEDNKPPYAFCALDTNCELWKDGFQKGAEFGYNKANEWHYVKDGDLPKENQLVLLYRENSNGANIALTYWYKSYVKDKVIAWKEIALPKEIE